MDAFIYSPLMHESYAGTVYDKLFHVTDWFPTLLELSGTLSPPIYVSFSSTLSFPLLFLKGIFSELYHFHTH